MGYLEEYQARQRQMVEDRAERLRREDEEKERNHRAWLRLCGMLSPIGNLK